MCKQTFWKLLIKKDDSSWFPSIAEFPIIKVTNNQVVLSFRDQIDFYEAFFLLGGTGTCKAVIAGSTCLLNGHVDNDKLHLEFNDGDVITFKMEEATYQDFLTYIYNYKRDAYKQKYN